MTPPVACWHRLRAVCLVVCALVACGVAPSQGGSKGGSDRAVADQKLAAYDAVAKGDFAARAKALAALGPVEDSRVTAILERELDAATTSNEQVAVLGAMAAAVRPRVVGAVYGLMVGPRTSPAALKAGAQCLANQGNRGIDVLRELAEDPPSSVPQSNRARLRTECLAGLAQANEDRAWRALAALSLSGSDRERLDVMRLLEKAPASSLVQRARQDAARSTNVDLATSAMQQLVETPSASSRRLVEDVYQRIGSGPLSDAAGAAFTRSMAKVLAPSLYDKLLRVSSTSGRQVSRALREVAPEATRDVGFVRFLVQEGLSMPSPERETARAWLQHADKAVARVELVELRDDLRSIGAGDTETILVLHPLFKDDPTWPEDLVRVAEASPWELKTIGMSLLADIGFGGALPLAHRYLDHRDWQVRSAAFAFCGKVRDVSSIPLLIRRMDHEEGRLREDLLDALQDLTGYRFLQANRWQRFWEEDGPGFKMPPVRKRDRASTASTSTKGFFNIPVVSDRVAFVIDVSGSMSAKVGTGGNRTRLSEAKRQLEIAIQAMAGDRFFNVIVYGTAVRSLNDRLSKATEGNKQDMLAKVRALKLTGATNIHGALEMAFGDSDVDTIFLLTDGQPSAGRIVDADDLADEVARWNLSRRIVIHTVSIGPNSKLMRRLAEESGGSFVHVR